VGVSVVVFSFFPFQVFAGVRFQKESELYLTSQCFQEIMVLLFLFVNRQN